MLFQFTKKTWKNKILSVCLLVAMLITMLPVSAGTAYAAEMTTGQENKETTLSEEVFEETSAEAEGESEVFTAEETSAAESEATDESEAEKNARAAEESVKLQIQYGKQVYKITETDWAKLAAEKEKTYRYSANHRSAAVYTDEFTGVPLNDIVAFVGIDVTKLQGSESVIFRSDDGMTMQKMSVDAVFQTTRYWYPYDTANSKFVEDGKTEVPIMITSKATASNNRLGRLIVGMSAIDNGSGEFVKQYWWNGLFNTAEKNFISIEIPAAASADQETEEETSTEEEKTGFASGNGSESNPYQIATAAQLTYLAEQVNSGTTYEGVYFQLANDIDLQNQTWTPIGGGAALKNADAEGYDCGTPTYKFLGTFDGNGKTIQNLKVESNANFAGFFGHNGGTLKNFTLEGTLSVTGAHDYAGAVVAFNSGTITHVINKVTINAPNTYNVGGIVGINVGLEGKWKDGANNAKQNTVKMQ